MKTILISCVLTCVGFGVRAQEAPKAPEPVAKKPNPGLANWGQWRGPLQTGVAPHAKPPTTWSEKQNVRWKVEIPGAGYGSPVVWNDRVYVSTAIPFGEPVPPVPDDAPGAHDNARVTQKHEFALLALDRATGRTVWRTSLHKQLPHEGFHKSSALAAASPCTDGEHVIAFFGSYGLYCVDVDGKIAWKRDLGDLRIKHGHGEGASPVLHGNTLVVNWDHRGDDFLVALDKRTGVERWHAARDEPTSWSSPIVVAHGGRHHVVVSSTGGVRGYDLESGKVLWHARGMSNNVVATPVAGNGIVYAGSSYVKKRMMAIRLEGASGDVTSTEQILWRRGARTPYVPSPLLLDGWLYFLTHYQGFLSRVEGRSGAEATRPLRLPRMFEIYASPVAANGYVYVTDRDGATLVLAHDPGEDGTKPMRIVARNELEDGFNASAAIAGDEIFLRGLSHLYCIGITREVGNREPQDKRK